jgi:hypothetical protein
MTTSSGLTSMKTIDMKGWTTPILITLSHFVYLIIYQCMAILKIGSNARTFS